MCLHVCMCSLKVPVTVHKDTLVLIMCIHQHINQHSQQTWTLALPANGRAWPTPTRQMQSLLPPIKACSPACLTTTSRHTNEPTQREGACAQNKGYTHGKN